MDRGVREALLPCMLLQVLGVDYLLVPGRTGPRPNRSVRFSRFKEIGYKYLFKCNRGRGQESERVITL